MTINYTLDVLLYQKERLECLLKEAKYRDEVNFYTSCLAEVNKDIDNIGKNVTISSKNKQNNVISE